MELVKLVLSNGILGVATVSLFCWIMKLMRIENKEREAQPFAGWLRCPNCKGSYAAMSSNIENYCCEACQKEHQDVQYLERLYIQK